MGNRWEAILLNVSITLISDDGHGFIDFEMHTSRVDHAYESRFALISMKRNGKM